MALSSVSYVFVTATAAEADQVNQNFTDLVDFLNNNVLHKDGSKALTGNLDLGSQRIINVNTPDAATDAANKAYADAVIPVGMIVPYAGGGDNAAGVAPTGWLLCNGQAVNRTTYAALFAVCGTAFGAGNGTTTFNVPDFRGKMPFGSDGTRARGATGGSNDAIVVAHTHTGPSHSHTFSGSTSSDGNHTHGTDGGVVAQNSGQVALGAGFQVGTTSINSAGSHTHTYSGTTSAAGTGATGSAGSSGTNANLSAYQAVNFMIRAGV